MPNGNTTFNSRGRYTARLGRGLYYRGTIPKGRPSAASTILGLAVLLVGAAILAGILAR